MSVYIWGLIVHSRLMLATESDVNLLASEEYYDVHAVAGLLKLYLRELPTNILTSERRDDFVRVTEIEDKDKKIQALNELVHRLPIEHFTLLKALSGHLIRIIDNAAVNKMTVRNVGIVFSPTLNIPAQVFALFLHEYYSIFGQEHNDESHDEKHNHNQQQQQQPQQQPQEQTHDPNLLQPRRSEKPRQLSFNRLERPGLEPPRSATLPLSPSLRPSYDTPHYDRPHPYYDQGSYGNPHRASYIPLDQTLSSVQQDQPIAIQQSPPTQDGTNSASLDVKSAKSRRRESSMLNVMGMGVRKSILPPKTPQGTCKLRPPSPHITWIR